MSRGPSSDKSERQQRLAEALRANLRRRKGQARERTQDSDGIAGQKAPLPTTDTD